MEFKNLPLGATLLLASPALATHPFSTHDSGTQSPGAVELELSGTGVGGANDESWVELGSALHVGVLDRLEGGFAVVYGFSPDRGDSWMYDPWVDVKYRLLDGQRWAPSLALSAQYKPPQRADGESTGNGACLDLVGSVFFDRLGLHANVGATGEGLGTTEDAWLLHTAAAAVFRGSNGLEAGLDVMVDSTAEGPASMGSTAALIWETASRRFLSLGLGPHWNQGHSMGWQVTAALTAGFGG